MTDDLEMVPMMNASNHETVPGGKTPISLRKRAEYFAIGLGSGLVIGLVLFLGLYFGLPQTCSTADDNTPSEENPLYAEYLTTAVAADAGPCSVIGKNKLKAGGSAVDAAIAALLCVGLYNAHSTGIGGGSFMSLYNVQTNEAMFINSREVAPMDGYSDMYGGNSSLSTTGASAIAVPGEIAGYWEAHQRFGKLKWSELFQEAIKLAEEGYEVNSALAGAINSKRSIIMDPSYNLKPLFTNSDGSLKKEGDVVINSELGQTFRTIAEEGMSAFYTGKLADDILADIRDAPAGMPSLIKKDDLQNYKVQVKPLKNITLDDRIVLMPGAPSGGPVLALILNILEGYKFTSEDAKDVNSLVLTYHRVVEAFKFAYAKRTELGDERFNSNITELVNRMTSDAYAEELRLKINDSTTQPTAYYEPEFALTPDDQGTSHLSIIVKDGMAVSVTSTINAYFGSSVRGKRTGIIFNNEMDDFSSPNITNIFGVPPSPNNFIEPGKRPLSSMSPAIVISKKNGKMSVDLVAGASGGTKITTGTALTIIKNLWFGMRIDDAVFGKRLHHQLLPEEVQYEDGFQGDIVNGLQGKNHKTKFYNPPGSVVQAIRRKDDNTLAAACDNRKSGYPAGF